MLITEFYFKPLDTQVTSSSKRADKTKIKSYAKLTFT